MRHSADFQKRNLTAETAFKNAQAIRRRNVTAIIKSKQLVSSSRMLKLLAQHSEARDYETCYQLFQEHEHLWLGILHGAAPALQRCLQWIERARGTASDLILIEQGKTWVPPIDDSEIDAPGGSSGFFELIGFD